MGVAKKEKYLSPADDITWRPKFLQSLLQFEGDVEKACTQAGVAKIFAYMARHRDPDFWQDWEDVSEVIRQKRADELEEAFHERAVKGSKKKTFDRVTGNLTGVEQVFDTPAGITLLKGYRPEKFVEDPRKNQPSEIQSVTELIRAINEAGLPLGTKKPAPALPEARPTVIEIMAQRQAAK